LEIFPLDFHPSTKKRNRNAALPYGRSAERNPVLQISRALEVSVTNAGKTTKIFLRYS
jgi:hypothetical protein